MTTAAASDADILAVFERLALAAGREIMTVFNGQFDVAEKADFSPVTEADKASERVILEGLREAFPDIPCIAEEEMAEGTAPVEIGDAFFLIDPLDGTREFINRNTDFTVNIALVRDGIPEIGVVYAPAGRRFFSGKPGQAESIELADDDAIASRRSVAVRAGSMPLTIVASRSHATLETDNFIRKFEAAELVSVGSSLKFCLLACGEADLYPRFGRTMEWDTAAGDAVLRAAGGSTSTVDGAPLTYGKRNQATDTDFANPFFIARGDVRGVAI